MCMNRELLEKPFTPEQIKRRQGTNGGVLDYIAVDPAWFQIPTPCGCITVNLAGTQVDGSTIRS